jgi:hypothetical protein
VSSACPTLRNHPKSALVKAPDMQTQGLSMKNDFRSALKWHMEQTQTTIAVLARGAGISEDIVKKIRSRDGASTKQEAASKIAAFFGKDMQAFIACEDVGRSGTPEQIASLAPLLTPQEQEMLLAQIRGILSSRCKQ